MTGKGKGRLEKRENGHERDQEREGKYGEKRKGKGKHGELRKGTKRKEGERTGNYLLYGHQRTSARSRKENKSRKVKRNVRS